MGRQDGPLVVETMSKNPFYVSLLIYLVDISNDMSQDKAYIKNNKSLLLLQISNIVCSLQKT